MHVCLITLLICAYLGIGCLLLPGVKLSKLPRPGWTTSILSAFAIAGLLYGLLQGAFYG